VAPTPNPVAGASECPGLKGVSCFGVAADPSSTNVSIEPFTWAVLSWAGDLDPSMIERDLCMEQKANTIGEFQIQGNKTRDDNNEGETNMAAALGQTVFEL
jgi:hypothetical protein